jgi:Fe-S cluster biogenesis protein NfuA
MLEYLRSIFLADRGVNGVAVSDKKVACVTVATRTSDPLGFATTQGGDVGSDLLDRAERVVQRLVRPLVVADGGDVQVVTCTNLGVVIRLGGACSGCPGRPYTLSRLIEPVMRQEFGEAFTVTVERG